jgi:predicted transcriptional regulator
VLVGGHFAPEVQTALKIIAAEERTTVQALLAEAINTVFAKRRKPEIADISAT